jgi:hypothetical protein
MLIAALLIGLLAAYYLGPRPGVVAAGAAFALFLVAMVIPPLALVAYGVVGAGVVGLCLVGPSRKRPGPQDKLVAWAKVAALRLWQRKGGGEPRGR